jgi:uncharacterized protein YjbI with pentapeptide repeats
MRGATLAGKLMSNATLREYDLRNAIIIHVKPDNIKLHGVNMWGVSLEMASLVEA